jgi:hypothetical protein
MLMGNYMDDKPASRRGGKLLLLLSLLLLLLPTLSMMGVLSRSPCEALLM